MRKVKEWHCEAKRWQSSVLQSEAEERKRQEWLGNGMAKRSVGKAVCCEE
jgi:hypothetical protein